VCVCACAQDCVYLCDETFADGWMDRCGEMVGWIATRQHRWHVFAWSGAERHVADGPHVFCGVSHKNMLAVEGMHFADWVSKRGCAFTG